MHLKPGKEKFLRLSRGSRRVPVCGEKAVPGLDPALLYQSLFAASGESFLFESGGGPGSTARYSLMGEGNRRSILAVNDMAFFSDNGYTRSAPGSPLFCLERLNFDNAAPMVDYLPHFWGGWVGFLGYEVGTGLERRAARDDLPLPDLHFLQVDRVFAYDHATGILKYIAAPEIADDAAAHYDRCADEIARVWNKVDGMLPHLQKDDDDKPDAAPPTAGNGNPVLKLRANVTREQYLSMVEKAKRYIEAGDIYQANLSQRFEADYPGDPLTLYLKLRSVNPSPFSGYLKFKDLALVSSSPERLVKLEGNRLETRPIAGTRPRGGTQREDDALSAELLLNEKEKAEHLMLVDLERNDLGRVCEYGSVRVTDLMFLEKYSHVSHIVSNIEGRPVAGVSPADILRAVFPGGTITGCPKIRCMEIIDELEPTRRGPYSGSFGYIGFSAHMDFNIIIRTIVVKDGKAYFHVGAGIVADSIPEKEYQETLDKAAAMMQALAPNG
ncbi:MAG: anthranilate synthase component I family protein [Nitrospinales bacterium]